jgi:hypothetical protein
MIYVLEIAVDPRLSERSPEKQPIGISNTVFHQPALYRPPSAASTA